MTKTDVMLENRELEQFLEEVQYNCDVSDASGSSIFSICGMALRFRDLNKWENGLAPWEENNQADLLNWIDAKERKWESLEGRDFRNLPLFGNIYDPFETQSINRLLVPLDLYYGAGYAHSLKPTFFLAQIRERLGLNGTSILIVDRELIRDLLTIPALGQDGAVVVRRDTARLFLWDQMAYLKKSGQRFLRFALRHCGLPDSGSESRKAYFRAILSVQEQTYIHHEIGEMKDTVFNREMFREMIADFPHSAVEFLIRTVKDLLADTGPQGTLQHLIATRNVAGIGLYAAFQDGLFLPLFPELRQAVEKFVSDNDWEGIEAARVRGFQTASRYAQDLMTIYGESGGRGDRQAVQDRIMTKLVQPLIR